MGGRAKRGLRHQTLDLKMFGEEKRFSLLWSRVSTTKQESLITSVSSSGIDFLDSQISAFVKVGKLVTFFFCSCVNDESPDKPFQPSLMVWGQPGHTPSAVGMVSLVKFQVNFLQSFTITIVCKKCKNFLQSI
jgi:hypothetical protein